MPKLKKKWNEIEESTGAFSDIEPGAYKLVITKVEPNEGMEYARIYWDVAEGPSKGAYAQSQFPPSDVLSWKDTALGMLKHKLHVLAESNAGFQPTVAFDSDDWQAFVGKSFGAVVRKRLYTAGPRSKNPGADRESVEVAAWLMPDDLAAGKFSENLLKPRDTREKQPQQAASVPDTYQPATTPDLYGEDIPF